MCAIACLANLSRQTGDSGLRNMAARNGSILAAMSVVLLLTGCATRQSLELPDISNWNSRTAVLGGIEVW
jgi:hypothetical protein